MSYNNVNEIYYSVFTNKFVTSLSEHICVFTFSLVLNRTTFIYLSCTYAHIFRHHFVSIFTQKSLKHIQFGFLFIIRVACFKCIFGIYLVN